MSREKLEVYRDYDLALLRTGLRNQLKQLDPYLLGKVMITVQESYALLCERAQFSVNRRPELNDVTSITIMCVEMDATALPKGMVVDISDVATHVQDHGEAKNPANLHIAIHVNYAWFPTKDTPFKKDFGVNPTLLASIQTVVKGPSKNVALAADDTIPPVVSDVVREEEISLSDWIRSILKGKFF